jgi:hypothetical protein
MLRLHSDSSRSYPGRPARRVVVFYDSAQYGNMPGDRTGVSRGHSRREETSPVKRRKAGKDLPRRRTEHREGKNIYEFS